MITTSPYQYYNLRRNPFGELTREERAELAVLDVDRWLAFLHSDRAVLQFMGPCGHGKTTHLLAIQRELYDAQYIYLPEDGPQPSIGNHRPMLIDEAQRLSFWRLRRVLTVGGPLVLGTHVDLTRAIRSARLDELTIDVSANCSTQLLTQIINRRIDASRLSAGPVPYVDEQLVVRLLREFGSNIRAIEHSLYEQFQSCAQEHQTWPPAT